MEAQSDAVVSNNVMSAGRSICPGCGTTVPSSYPACLRCGSEVPSLDRLRYATFQLRMLNERTEARLAEESVPAPVVAAGPPVATPESPLGDMQSDDGVSASPVVAMAENGLDHTEPNDGDEPVEAAGLLEPVEISSVRTKRSWLRMPFLRKAS